MIRREYKHVLRSIVVTGGLLEPEEVIDIGGPTVFQYGHSGVAAPKWLRKFTF